MQCAIHRRTITGTASLSTLKPFFVLPASAKVRSQARYVRSALRKLASDGIYAFSLSVITSVMQISEIRATNGPLDCAIVSISDVPVRDTHLRNLENW